MDPESVLLGVRPLCKVSKPLTHEADKDKSRASFPSGIERTVKGNGQLVQ